MGGIIRLPKTDKFQLKYPITSLDTYQLDKPIFFADTDRPGVYGHVLLEAVTRLWALRQLGIDVAVATSVRMNRNYQQLFTHLGAHPDNTIFIDRPI
ncbi:hypothetical protein GCM10011402_38070 [Paracoccus acridae]|uniref:N-acetyltransferase domain-containing protein n=1 Tax=Paracoccus acridae TaxID=1795310 RepID=A0ABQ1VMY0_9RHOB|nr:hypothetical protein GCM10011402_38070 [Paracoccus acridae]